MPSRSRPQLVGSLARGIADVGRMPMLGSLEVVDGGPAGGPGGNSAFRLAGVWGRFGAAGLNPPRGPVLLIDDLIDSRWKMTVAARELRRAGAHWALPFAPALRAWHAPAGRSALGVSD